jgi:hypothetical protein
MSAKAELYSAMQAIGVTKSELGRRLNWHQPQVDRLLNLTHSAQVDQLDAAVRALGGYFVVSVAGIPTTARRRIIGDIPRRMPFAAAVTSSVRAKPRSAGRKTRSAGRAAPRGPATKKK